MFIEVDSFPRTKYGPIAAGDVFLAQKCGAGNRIIAALSDGLGSGIKANVLASLTATMISKFVLMDIAPERAAEIIVNSLPVCSKRGLAYATFTLVEARKDMAARIIEYESPPAIVLRGSELVELEKERMPIERKNKNTGPENETLFLSKLQAAPGDRIVFFSDGVTQAGLGGNAFPAGWGLENVRAHVRRAVESEPHISAGALAHSVVQTAVTINDGHPKDDISCAVMYFRKPRNLLVMTGPPFRPESDREYARLFAEFPGKKIISGGTSAQIIARELGKALYQGRPPAAGFPAESQMDGADLVCEGILTLAAAAEELACAEHSHSPGSGPAACLTSLFLDSDSITFVVGTKINEAHQDPTMPAELEIRRNVVKRIKTILEEKYMKAVRVQYL
ncbi:MAG: serine/threonine-protein phosphatase [Spirochaetaceae bacterium]|jgi:hypothetical protein|nr:serine/threonine-protein phosphatase [Spirochaetaceae bacterium]